MNKWRPEGWENPYSLQEPHGYDLLIQADRQAAYERGADDMLKALKRTQTRWEQHIILQGYGRTYAVVHADGTLTVETMPQSGTLVFIPDDEERA